MPVSPNTWLNFAVVAFLVSLVPGPAFIIVLSTALRRGFRSALYANAGVVAGDAIYFFFTALGLGSLLAASYWAFTIVKWLGVTYLIYLGLRSLLYPASEIVGEGQSKGGTKGVRYCNYRSTSKSETVTLPGRVGPAVYRDWPTGCRSICDLGGTFMLSDAVVY